LIFVAKYIGVRKKGNKWYFRVNHRRKDGKRYQEEHGGYDTAAAAYEARKIYLAQMHKPKASPSELTIAEFVDQYMDHCREHCDQSTIRQYKWLAGCVKEMIGDRKLCEFKTRDVEQFCIDFRNAPQKRRPHRTNSVRSMVHMRNFLSGMFEYAIDMEIVTTNPVRRYRAPKPDKVPPRFWEEHEINAFLDAVSKSRYYIAFSLMAGTGCRLGEILALRWRYVDLEAGVIRIVKSITHAEKGYEEKDPKTEDSIRSITLPEPTLQDLRAHKLRQDKERELAGDKWEDNDLVVATSTGKHVAPHNLRMYMEKVRVRLGLPKLSPHGMRHTHATLLLADHEPLNAVAQRLGHKDPALTARTYAHVLPSTEWALAKTMGRHLRARNQ
jgi:integrase